MTPVIHPDGPDLMRKSEPFLGGWGSQELRISLQNLTKYISEGLILQNFLREDPQTPFSKFKHPISLFLAFRAAHSRGSDDANHAFCCFFRSKSL